MSAFGTVKSYNPTRRYGFITSQQGDDYFFHNNDVVGRPTKQGDVVQFDVAPSQKDPSKVDAKNVTGGTAGGSNKGTCKWYNGNKGYGFIDQEDGRSHFVHVNDLQGDMPQEGDTVWFDIELSEKDASKTCAKNVAGGSGGGKGGGKGGKMGMMMAWFGGGKGGGGPSKKPGDWTCPNCKDHQFKSNEKCRKCDTPHPGEGSDAVIKCKWCELGECWDHGQIEKPART